MAALLLTQLVVPTVASAQSPSVAPAQDSVDIHLAGRLLGRYVTAYDISSPQRKKETYKPFLHLLDPEGYDPITKGPGGEYTHHRGIFIGWYKIGFEGQTIDRWHMLGGEQVVQGKVDLHEGKDTTTAGSTVHWNDGAGKPFIVEKRTFTFRTPPAPAYLLLDFQSRLEATRGEVKLDGDPEHAGVHFRPSDALDRKTTVYLLPGSETKAQKSTDLPWIAESFVLNGRTYSVVQFNHPENPTGTRSSAYRDYGRIGMFPTATIPAGGNLVLRYRFLVSEGAFPEVSLIQSVANSFTGKNDPVPTVTRRQADVPPPPKPKVQKTVPANPSAAPAVDSGR
jgi:hypothetical protein